MALTKLQRRVCKLVADRRRIIGESYVAGGVALYEIVAAARISRDLDIFHDTHEAVASSARDDRAAFEGAGLAVETKRELTGFVEVLVRDADGDSVLVEWATDSAFRFFPLVAHAELGVTMHPLDLATNKVCALVGRVEVRDWIDTLTCHERVQPLGYLAWAVCGKDAGLSPTFILAQAARTARYSRVELESLAFAGPTPDFEERARVWRSALDEARSIVERVPAEHVGTCLLDLHGVPFRGSVAALESALAADELRFHQGSIRGALPLVRAQ